MFEYASVTPRNPDVLKGSNILTKGRIVIGYRKGDTNWTDFGEIDTITPARANTVSEFKGNRRGRSVTFKRRLAESVFSLTFTTAATGDPSVTEFYVGNKAIETPPTSGAFQATHPYALNDLVNATGRLYRVSTAGTSDATAPVWPTSAGQTVASDDVIFTDIGLIADNSVRAYSNDFELTDGAFIVIHSTAEGDGDRTVIRAFPNASLEGNGEPQIQNFDGYQFLLTALKNIGFTPPVAYGSFGSTTPDGVVYDVPNGMTDAVLGALAAALKTYVDTQ